MYQLTQIEVPDIVHKSIQQNSVAELSSLLVRALLHGWYTLLLIPYCNRRIKHDV